MSDQRSVKLTEKAARHSAEAYRKAMTETTDHDLTGPPLPPSIGFSPLNWQCGRNTAGVKIPAWSCVAIGAITGGSSVAYPGDGYCAALTQPAGTAGVQYGLTGSVDCPSKGPSGQPSLCGFHLEAGWACYDTGTPNPGEIWGPKSGQFTLSKGKPGFVIVRIVDAARKIALVTPSGGGVTLAWAALSETMSSTTSAPTVSAITCFDGSTDSATSISNPNGHAAANGARVTVALDSSTGTPAWIVIDAPKFDVTVITVGSGGALATQQIAVELDGAAGTLSTTPCSGG